jgi:hypothetical protein
MFLPVSIMTDQPVLPGNTNPDLRRNSWDVPELLSLG